MLPNRLCRINTGSNAMCGALWGKSMRLLYWKELIQGLRVPAATLCAKGIAILDALTTQCDPLIAKFWL